MIIFTSCEKNENNLESKDNVHLANFKTALNNSNLNLKKSVCKANGNLLSKESDLTETVFLEFPDDAVVPNMSLFNDVNTISELSDLINSTDAIVQQEESLTNSDYRVTIPVAPIFATLNPLIEAAKTYLISKGFTNATIHQMIISEGGTEWDLIPYVMSLYYIETGGTFPGFEFNPNDRLNANDFIRCAIVAIGADVLYALGTSSCASWTMPLMKKAFGAVAKRMLGPIGAAFAVVSFGICIGEAYYD